MVRNSLVKSLKPTNFIGRKGNEMNEKKHWTIVDELAFNFGLLYTSPSWGGDERTPEGWIKKQAELKKIFAITLKQYNISPDLYGKLRGEKSGAQ